MQNSIKWQEFMRVTPNTTYERESTLFFISSARSKHIPSSRGHHEGNSSAPSLKKGCSKSSAVSMLISVIKMKFSEFKSSGNVISGLEAARCEFDHEVQIESPKQEQSGSHERGAQDFYAAELRGTNLKANGKASLKGKKSPNNWVENPNSMSNPILMVLDSGSDHYLEYTNDPMSILQKLAWLAAQPGPTSHTCWELLPVMVRSPTASCGDCVGRSGEVWVAVWLGSQPHAASWLARAINALRPVPVGRCRG
ncbi:hypothetical protein K438DRAFT_1783623 [Mycena galopus ATCC 62051]|nr:hypothetical protein K438DRAFT_1783623 [Mycena galopus ATCC 62051]